MTTLADRHVDRSHDDAVLARIAHQLRRGIEVHRLAVEQGREKRVWMSGEKNVRSAPSVRRSRHIELATMSTCG